MQIITDMEPSKLQILSEEWVIAGARELTNVHNSLAHRIQNHFQTYKDAERLYGPENAPVLQLQRYPQSRILRIFSGGVQFIQHKAEIITLEWINMSSYDLIQVCMLLKKDDGLSQPPSSNL